MQRKRENKEVVKIDKGNMDEIRKMLSKLCNRPCTKIVKFLTDHEVPANLGISVPPYTECDGYRYINVFVRFSQEEPGELPVDLGVIFAFEENGEMGARRYVNLEANLPSPQTTQMVSVSGSGTWHGSQTKISSYLARFPVMGPYVQVFVYNKAAIKRTVNVWAYLTS